MAVVAQRLRTPPDELADAGWHLGRIDAIEVRLQPLRIKLGDAKGDGSLMISSQSPARSPSSPSISKAWPSARMNGAIL